MTERRYGALTWTQSGDKWYSHFREHRLRARQHGNRWIVGHEVTGGAWALIGNGPTLEYVAHIAAEWVRA